MFPGGMDCQARAEPEVRTGRKTGQTALSTRPERKSVFAENGGALGQRSQSRFSRESRGAAPVLFE